MRGTRARDGKHRRRVAGTARPWRLDIFCSWWAEATCAATGLFLALDETPESYRLTDHLQPAPSVRHQQSSPAMQARSTFAIHGLHIFRWERRARSAKRRLDRYSLRRSAPLVAYCYAVMDAQNIPNSNASRPELEVRSSVAQHKKNKQKTCPSARACGDHGSSMYVHI